MTNANPATMKTYICILANCVVIAAAAAAGGVGGETMVAGLCVSCGLGAAVVTFTAETLTAKPAEAPDDDVDGSGRTL